MITHHEGQKPPGSLAIGAFIAVIVFVSGYAYASGNRGPCMHWSIVSVIAAVGIATLWGVWWLWWRFPMRQVERLRLTIRDPKARADVEDNFRKTITQVFGGIVVLFGGAAAIGAGVVAPE